MEQKGNAEGTLLQCGNCKKNFSPRIKVNINEKIVESFELTSCWDMLEFIKKEFMTNKKFDIEKKIMKNFFGMLCSISL